MQFWRSNSPKLRSERNDDKKSDIYHDDQLGLAAIEAESEDTAWSSKLSPDEAKLAARYVPNVLNGFPVWIGKLVATHPLDVESILGTELIAELNEQSATSSFSMLLQNVHYANKEVAAIFILRLVAWLTENASHMRNGEEISATVDRLQKVGDVLSRHGDAKVHEQLKVIALQQLERKADPAFTRAWIPLLMQVDPATGTTWLEKVLRDVEPSQNGAGVDWIAHLFYDPHSTKIINLYNSKFTPALLLKLVRLAYRFVRLADDIQHEGVYTPDKRDHAQEARNALLSALLATNGADGWAAKCELANDPDFEHFRDRAMLIAQKKAADEADFAIITEAEIAALSHNMELSPHTLDDMHRLLVDRLDDLDDLLAQDESPRELWATIDQERLMRREIAGALRNAARGAYKVDQESVTANEHETDIRLRATASEQEAVIELKLGKNYSGRDLRDTIKNQLVKKYMAPETRRAGCLMVTVTSNKTWKHPDSDETLDAADLRLMLEIEAKKIEESMGFGVRLVVRILDLRQRSQNPVSAATLE